MTSPMQCTSCGETRAWPDDFPNLPYAECWKCVLARVSREHSRATALWFWLGVIITAGVHEHSIL